MDILYLFSGRTGSEHLRYSLRSIEKNCKNVGKVFLVGHKPEWCKNVIEIPYDSDPALYKENDITKAIFHAVENSKIGNRFLISADDYFYIDPTDLATYPVYRKGELPDTREGKESMGGWKYVQSLVNTRQILTEAGLPTDNYSQHALFYGDRKLMKKYKALFDKAFGYEFGAVYDTLMSALIVANDKKAVVVNRKDNKIHYIENMAYLRNAIGDTEVFSTAPMAWENGAKKLLSELFPEPSKYEK